jgi:glycosyltransferase involved in cell wall biosynthesis
MNLAIVSDVFPPKCGGSGWSSFFLARALVERGHQVQVVVPKEGPAFRTATREYEGLAITEYYYPASKIPFVRNYSRNEQLYPPFADWLQNFFKDHHIQLAHAQHYLSIPPTVMACARLGVASVATVRDYWPVCYWTTRLSGEAICPGCSELNRLKCLYKNQGALGLVAAPVSLYMAANLRLKQKWLAQADATLAVSHYIASNLEPFVPPTRLRVLPNFIDLASLEKFGQQAPTTKEATSSPYLLYVGKLEANKGALMLLDLLKEARSELPVLIAGEGSLREEMERQATAHQLNVKFLGWVDHDEVLRLMAHCEALVYPSLWPEPLTRVLLEALGLGTLVLALNTGGTPDIIQHNQNGILVDSLAELAQQLKTLLSPEQAVTCSRLREAALASARQKFSQEVVVAQVEQLYHTLFSEKE